MRHVAVDTNLLLLLLIGTVAPEFVERHKRLRAYDLDDYRLILEFLIDAESVVITPNVATELVNLAGQGVSEPLRTELFVHLKNWLPTLPELALSTARAVTVPEFTRLGLTDSVWLAALEPGTELLTDDITLYLAALRRGLPATNLNHIRESVAFG